MRNLFDIDLHDYDLDGEAVLRPSARAIIIRDGKIAMMNSKKYGYYKFPGGGIEANETRIDALIRETKEESGLTVIKESIKEYGWVHRIQKGDYEPVWIQDNYYYLCDVEGELSNAKLDAYELEEGFNLVFIDPKEAIKLNKDAYELGGDKVMIDRENKVLSMLIEELYFKK